MNAFSYIDVCAVILKGVPMYAYVVIDIKCVLIYAYVVIDA